MSVLILNPIRLVVIQYLLDVMATTSDELWRFPGQHEYDGIVYCIAMKPGALDRIKKLQLHPQDILISNYPKAGKPLNVSINDMSIKQFAWITQYRKLYGFFKKCKCWLIVNFMVVNQHDVHGFCC